MVLFLCFSLIIIWIIYHFYWKRYGLPPGPMPLPLIGNMHQFNREPCWYNLFSLWEKEYGPIFTYWQGEQPIIVVTDYNLIVETFVKNGDATSDRHTNFLHNYSRLFRGSKPLGFFVTPSNGNKSWEEHRRFLMQYIKKINFGETYILDECEIILQKLSKLSVKNDNVIEDGNISELIDIGIGSVIQQILFGHRFNDDKIEEFKNLQQLLANHFGSYFRLCNLVVLLWPEILKYIPILNKDFSKLIESGKMLYEFHENEIQKHQKIHKNQFQNDSNIENATDFIDAFLRQRSRNFEISGGEGEFSLEQLRAISFDFWVATQVTATQIKYNLIMLIRHPEIQEKMQQELNQICGAGRVEIQHRSKLPYTNAVLNELRRLGCFVINPVPARQTRTQIIIDKKIVIPAGTAIQPIFSTVLFNEKLFPEPHKFIPERFLSSLSQHEIIDDEINKSEYLIGFGLGKRQCLGEPISKFEDFLITANLIHQFKFAPIDPENLPSNEKVFGVVVSLKENNFKCKIIPRF